MSIVKIGKLYKSVSKGNSSFDCIIKPIKPYESLNTDDYWIEVVKVGKQNIDNVKKGRKFIITKQSFIDNKYIPINNKIKKL